MEQSDRSVDVARLVVTLEITERCEVGLIGGGGFRATGGASGRSFEMEEGGYALYGLIFDTRQITGCASEFAGT